MNDEGGSELLDKMCCQWWSHFLNFQINRLTQREKKWQLQTLTISVTWTFVALNPVTKFWNFKVSIITEELGQLWILWQVQIGHPHGDLHSGEHVCHRILSINKGCSQKLGACLINRPMFWTANVYHLICRCIQDVSRNKTIESRWIKQWIVEIF